MKKLTSSITAVLFVLFLAACGSEETKTFKLEEDGVVSTLVYTYKGDKVTKQTTKNVVPYDQIGITSKEQAQEMFEPLAKQFENIDGITHEIEFDDTQLIENLTIDYETVKFKEIENLPGMNFTGNTDEGISMKESIELLESQGFKEEK